MAIKPRSLRSLMESSRHLRTLLERLREDDTLTARVRGLLPPDLAAHLAGAQERDGRLVLLARSPVWASRLRYAAAGLSRGMGRRSGLGAEVRVRVLPLALPPQGRRPPRRMPPMSATTAGYVRAIAGAVADPQLGAALRRLAAHAEGGGAGGEKKA